MLPFLLELQGAGECEKAAELGPHQASHVLTPQRDLEPGQIRHLRGFPRA